MNTQLTVQQLRILEVYQTRIPRFLFRGFYPGSGGGDPRLNNSQGVIPHGFLNNEIPTSIRDIQNLRRMISGHLTGHRIPSCFSSWAADIEVAIRYSVRGSIAILDTNLVEPHVKIYHVLGFYEAGIASWHYDHEYLVYGPVRGRAYHCVRYAAIENGLTPIPRNLDNLPERISRVTEAAYIFRRADDTRPDVVIALVAVLTAYHAHAHPWDLDHFVYLMAQKFRAELLNLELPNPGVSSRLGLANASTHVAKYPGLAWAVRALVRLEDYVRGQRVLGYF